MDLSALTNNHKLNNIHFYKNCRVIIFHLRLAYFTIMNCRIYVLLILFILTINAYNSFDLSAFSYAFPPRHVLQNTV